MKLPKESVQQRQSESRIGEADFARAMAWVAAFDFPVKYLDGKTVKTIAAKVLRGLWGAK